MKDPLVQYYLNQAGRGSLMGGSVPFIRSSVSFNAEILSAVLSNLFRLVRRVVWSGVNAVGRETLHKGGKILTDIEDTDTKPPIS
jgi:hypothetical protein